MSENPFTIDEPFDPAALDEQTELRTLARALHFAQGFKLFFVRCNQHDQRQRLADALQKELPQLAVQEIHFDAPIDHLLDALRERLTQPPLDAVFASGLEYSLPTAADAHATPFVANLNAARNSFPQVLPCPLVLWMPEYVLTAIIRGAPDFFSVRSGVYYFAATPQETAAFAESLAAGEEWQAALLPFEEKQERIAAIESLLDDYCTLSSTQRDRRAEARLLTRLGGLYWRLARWAEAEKYYQQNLEIYREIGDRVHEGITLKNLGNVYYSQGRLAEAEHCYQRSLEISQEVRDRVNEGAAFIGFGNLYYSQERWAEAEKYYQQSLEINREVGDRVREGITLNNLGLVYSNQGRWAEAEKYYQQSLGISQKVGDRLSEGQILNNLGLVYDEQGRWTEAEKAYQQSLEINREVGDRVSEGRTLKNLALLREVRGDITEALEIGRQAVVVLETTEDKMELEKARQLVAKWEAAVEHEASSNQRQESR